MNTPPKPAESATRFNWLRWAILAGVLAAIGAGVVMWLRVSAQQNADELAAKAELAKLGALVVMDSQRKHVSSVNLSTLQSPATLDQAISLLPAFTHLNSLNADHTAFRDEHALVVGQISSLQDLVLSPTEITDAALKNLQRLSQLKTIHLADTAVTNACIPSLGQLRALTIVDLSGTKVTGDLQPLSDLANLSWLVAKRLSIDAAAVAAVGDCQSLSRLTLNETTCPAEALDELTQKRPNLTVDR